MASLLKGFGFITGAASGKEDFHSICVSEVVLRSRMLKGIGKATAFSFAKYGAKGVAIGDLNSKAVQATAAELKNAFPNLEVLPLEVDVTNEEAIDRAVAETASQFGRIDYAVNNAGIGGSHALSAEHK